MSVSAARPSRDPVLSALRIAEVAGIVLGAALIGMLHFVRPTSGIDPLTVTISEYGRSPLAVVFVAGVVLIAAGSAATLVLLVRAGVCRAASIPSLGLALWVAGMVGVAVVQKADWAAGATLGGYIHRAASVVAFVALPIAILALAAGTVRRREPDAARASDRRLHALALALTAALLLVMTGLAVYIAGAESDGIAWWTVLPIGLVERAIVFAELVALALLVVGTRLRPAHGAAARR